MPESGRAGIRPARFNVQVAFPAGKDELLLARGKFSLQRALAGRGARAADFG